MLWRLDQGELLRFSHENPDVKALYKDYLGAPLGEKSHHLLHTDHNAWQMPQKMLEGRKKTPYEISHTEFFIAEFYRVYAPYSLMMAQS